MGQKDGTPRSITYPAYLSKISYAIRGAPLMVGELSAFIRSDQHRWSCFPKVTPIPKEASQITFKNEYANIIADAVEKVSAQECQDGLVVHKSQVVVVMAAILSRKCTRKTIEGAVQGITQRTESLPFEFKSLREEVVGAFARTMTETESSRSTRRTRRVLKVMSSTRSMSRCTPAL